MFQIPSDITRAMFESCLVVLMTPTVGIRRKYQSGLAGWIDKAHRPPPLTEQHFILILQAFRTAFFGMQAWTIARPRLVEPFREAKLIAITAATLLGTWFLSIAISKWQEPKA